MNIQKFQNTLNSYNWIDARVVDVQGIHMLDECNLSFETIDKIVTLNFSKCYQVKFEHDSEYDKLRAVKDMTVSQIPYFLQNISVLPIKDNLFNEIVIDAYPMLLKITCKHLDISEKIREI